jgi:hypothetical protein
MVDVITRNSSPTADLPGLLLVERYDAPTEVRNIVLPQMSSPAVTVIYRPSPPPAGTLALLFGSLADVNAAVALLVTEHTFTLASDEPNADMDFVVAPGQLRPQLDDTTRKYWLLEVPFQELSA